MLYSSDAEFLAGTVPFLRAAVEAGEPALVVLAPAKNDLLRAALGDDGKYVRFADMTVVGRNPACIIPAWTDFLDASAAEGRAVRGIGEPVSASRTATELAEAQLHEALLNRAFAGRPGFWLRCPYDMATLAPDVIAAAARTHPVVGHAGLGHSKVRGASHRGMVDMGTLERQLPEPQTVLAMSRFDRSTLDVVRQVVREHAARGGLGSEKVRRLVLAVHEVAANSIRHGGGSGTLRVWRDGGSLVCEIRDRGRIRDPLVGRTRPLPNATGGRGLWIANQICDLVQIRSTAAGTAVRVHQSGLGDATGLGDSAGFGDATGFGDTTGFRDAAGS
jgi:anti-sigma regulatory factor (Ser/Thr protein kinase)